jgi:REP element-mobilizing transposase RayT
MSPRTITAAATPRMKRVADRRSGGSRPRRSRQLPLELPARPKRGGARPGAGRPRVRPLPEGWRPGRRFVPHRTRSALAARHPLHITVRLRRIVKTLRNGKLHRHVERVLAAGCLRGGFRLVQYSVQGDHIHLIVETTDRRTLTAGMKGLNVRLARALNRVLSRRGSVVADRYHERVLTTPTEVRRALLYVLNNARHHAAEAGATYSSSWLDPFSSAPWFDGWRRPSGVPPDGSDRRIGGGPSTAAPRTWLLSTGWLRAGGLLDPAAVPGPTPPPAFHE